MVWIKRNLLLVVSGLVGLILSGLGTYLVMAGLTRNKELSGESESTRSRASLLYDANPFPSQSNIEAAIKETNTLHAAIVRARNFFAAVPLDKMDVKRFMVWRDESLRELRDAAKKAGTELPASDYSFSFATQRGKNQPSPDTIPHVPEQMAEVKVLCMMLFDARINRLGNVRRARVSADDKASAFASDYTAPGVLEVVPDPTGQMVSSPYEVTFYSFSAEVADVLNRLHRSPHGFLVKAIQVEPEDSKLAEAPGSAVAAVLPVAGTTPPPQTGRSRFLPPPTAPNRPAPPPAAARPPANDRPVHLLKEKRLKVTLLVYALKPAK